MNPKPHRVPVPSPRERDLLLSRMSSEMRLARIVRNDRGPHGAELPEYAGWIQFGRKQQVDIEDGLRAVMRETGVSIYEAQLHYRYYERDAVACAVVRVQEFERAISQVRLTTGCDREIAYQALMRLGSLTQDRQVDYAIRQIRNLNRVGEPQKSSL